MDYVRRQRRDSLTPLVVLLGVAGAIGLLTVYWRQRSAPRSRTQRKRADVPRHAARLAAVASRHRDVQTFHGGTGSVFHRQYEILLPNLPHGPADVLQLMQRNMSELAPSLLAKFSKASGTDGLLRVGDEYEISMLGPWNGAVRVLEVTPTSFTLVTLEGHPESGHITFSAATAADEAIRVRIESWARAKDGAVAAAYDTLKIGKQVQTEAWVSFLQRLGKLAGVERPGEVQIMDEEITAEDAQPAQGSEKTDA